MRKVLPKKWYNRNPRIVAIELLGKIIVRKIDNNILECRITETEAYFGPDDPASRATKGGDLEKTMKGPVGHALVYGIHRQWLFNVVAHEKNQYGAVLIRSCEPLRGIELMKLYRKTNSVSLLTTGPGRLTQALQIDKKFHKKPVYKTESSLWIIEEKRKENLEIQSSKRIGVTKDLDEPLRFFIKNNKFVSKKS